MGDILVSGLINIETTVRVDRFPIEYTPVRYPFFGVNADVSGVGYNVAKALVVLGDRVRFFSLIGRDIAATMIYEKLKIDHIPFEFVAAELEHTARSAILYDKTGKRQINVDLKDIQERQYPEALFESAAANCSLAVLCNINFSRPMLSKMGGVLIATDVHAISSLDDDYNRDFMRAAHILFMSDELLPCSPEAWARALWDRFGTPVTVVGLGAQGALLAVKDDGFIERIPAVYTRPVVNSIGAGDALFSCFVHFYHQTGDPYRAIKKAVVFASYKVGATSAADGFLSEQALNELVTSL